MRQQPLRLPENSLTYILPLLFFFCYALWMIGPYLYSTVIRDASVTAWSHLASAPIFGTIEYAQVRVNSRIPNDGVIARVTNPLASREALDRAQLRIRRAEEGLQLQTRHLREINNLLQGHLARRDKYAHHFNKSLDAEITHLTRQLTVAEEQLSTLSRIRQRKTALAAQSLASLNEVDDLSLQIFQLQQEIVQLQLRRTTVQLRHEAALVDVYLTLTGEDPEWVAEETNVLRLASLTAQRALDLATAELGAAYAVLEAEQAEYQRRNYAEIKLRPNSIFWRELISTGTNVTAGQTVAEWIECDNLLIDVPLSDAEVSLIHPGDAAEVVLEGEKSVRNAQVLLTRGAAATLGREDIAALAKSRNDEDVAQVLLTLATLPGEFPECPVGLAAYVNFPGVGIVDVVRARLRL